MDLNHEVSTQLSTFSLGKSDERFQRIEDKYIVRDFRVEKLLELLTKWMKPSYLHEKTQFNLIESQYFDSPHRDFFRHHFMKDLNTRFKLRLRRYGPDGSWENSPALLELKVKESGVSKKTRFRITSDQRQSLLASQPLGEITEEMRTLNSHLSEKKLTKRVRRVNDLWSLYELVPTQKITYERRAFEGDSFRVTLDHGVCSTELTPLSPQLINQLKIDPCWVLVQEMQKKYSVGQDYILELKHSGEIPSWMQEFLAQSDLEKTSFSKYCFFTAQSMGLSLQQDCQHVESNNK